MSSDDRAWVHTAHIISRDLWVIVPCLVRLRVCTLGQHPKLGHWFAYLYHINGGRDIPQSWSARSRAPTRTTSHSSLCGLRGRDASLRVPSVQRRSACRCHDGYLEVVKWGFAGLELLVKGLKADVLSCGGSLLNCADCCCDLWLDEAKSAFVTRNVSGGVWTQVSCELGGTCNDLSSCLLKW